MRRTVRAFGFCLLASAAMAAAGAPPAFTTVSAASPVPSCGGLEATIVGTAGNDEITGTDGDDVIVGLAGNDLINGGLGNDVICGGPGNDTLQGQGDDDVLFGDEGDDILDGGEGGCCRVDTNTGDDELHGGPGNDDLHTSDFPTLGNTLYGEQGADRLFVWSGGWAYGGNGDDEIYQFTGDAVLDGGNGNDLIVDWNDGALNHETITMIGANGDDQLTTMDTSSTVHMDGGRGTDGCTGGASTSGCES